MNYLQISSLLAGDNHLTEDERKSFCQEILDFANQQTENQGQKIILPMHSFAQLKTLHFDPPNAVVHVGGKLSIELTLLSQMPIPIQVDQIAIHVHFSIEKNNYRKTAEWLTKHKISNGVISFPNEVVGFPWSRNNLPALELYEMYERSPSDNSLNTAGIICKNVHMLLRRQESSSSLDKPSGLTLEDGAHVLKCHNLVLEPGVNKITFSTQAKEPGTYTLRQLCTSVGKIQFVLLHIYPIVQYDVYSQEPQLKVEPTTDSLLAGIPQKVKFTVTTGHYSMKSGDALQLSNADAMPILYNPESKAVIYSNIREKISESSLRIQSSEKITSISLPVAPAYHVIEFELEVMYLPSATESAEEGENTTNKEVQRKNKEKQKLDNCMATVDQKVTIDCPWSIYSTIIALTFCIPFNAKHSLLSAGKRKYVQVCIQNLSELCFQLSDNSLKNIADCTDLQLVPLNPESQQVKRLSWCSTLYHVKTEIFPPLGTEYCKTGSLCSLEVSITRLVDLSEVDRDEALTESDGYCTTKLMYEDSWIENDNLSVDKNVDDQADSSSIRSRGSLHSAASGEHKGLPMPRLQSFSSGQVFNCSTGMQILVIPSKDDHVLEVNIT
ncbi:hypothetical protein CIB84_000324 [Bambusicola thoracicus]|uniref:TRAPPC10 Ig-like domain-containing protein n=1 Tax=Bambusicola thoracicus TaxID=9083 RepID=A0A2P4THU9_BAMTH|nr:hypothetical protein CIB84_000324 [Bambusicola thoracicus]